MTRPREVRIAAFVSAANRDADVVTVAHEQELRDLPHRESKADDAVAAIVGMRKGAPPSPSAARSASTRSYASAAPADRGRQSRRSRSCRT